jgi:hypothetical protein
MTFEASATTAGTSPTRTSFLATDIRDRFASNLEMIRVRLGLLVASGTEREGGGQILLAILKREAPKCSRWYSSQLVEGKINFPAKTVGLERHSCVVV